LSYPGNDTLCEGCGYALKGLHAEGDCPECGLLIAESSPDLRGGPGDRERVDLGLIRRPRAFFRAMRVGGSNGPARWFMAKVILLIGLAWVLWGAVGGGWSLEADLYKAGVVMASLYLLSYVEVLGVVFFSRRRGWRVPFGLAERLVCYASIGWVPAVIVMGVALDRYEAGDIDRWMRPLLGVWGTWQSIELLVLVGTVAMLWFELLVWIGVRQTKYANFQAEAVPVGLNPE
jgi:hypothetical protein